MYSFEFEINIFTEPDLFNNHPRNNVESKKHKDEGKNDEMNETVPWPSLDERNSSHVVSVRNSLRVFGVKFSRERGKRRVGTRKISIFDVLSDRLRNNRLFLYVCRLRNSLRIVQKSEKV